MKKHLTDLVVFIFFGAFTTFATAQHKPFVPLEYEYPRSVLNEPKTYVYKNILTGVLRYKDITFEKRDHEIIIHWKEYDAAPLIDSCIEVNDKVLDHYLIINGLATKAVISEDSIYRDGSKLGEKVQTFYFELSSEISLLTSVRSFFLKDTTIAWQSKTAPSIVIQSYYRQKLINSLFPDKPKEINGVSYYYFAKDVGLIMYRTEMENEKSTWQLAEIKKRKN